MSEWFNDEVIGTLSSQTSSISVQSTTRSMLTPSKRTLYSHQTLNLSKKVQIIAKLWLTQYYV